MKPLPSPLLPLVLSLLGLHPAASAAVDWPQFRGPNASGVAESEKPPIHFDKASNVIWQVDVPPGHSSPCLWKDSVFLTGITDGKLETLCVDRTHGTVRWRSSVAPGQLEAFHDRDGSPAAPTPVTDGRRVYVYFGSFGVLAYDFSGTEQWQVRLPIPETGGFGTGTSPILADGLLVLNRDQNTNSQLLALHAETGRIAWSVARPDFIASFSTPTIWAHDNRKEVILAGFLRVKAYDLKDGAERWLAQGLPAAVCTTPVLGDGLLYVAAWSNGTSENPFPHFEIVAARADQDHDGILSKKEIFAAGMKDMFATVDINKDGQITREEWEAVRTMAARGRNVLLAIRPGGTGDITESHVAWKATKGLPYVPSPLYYRGRLFVVKDGGLVTCYDAKSGTLLFEQERLETGGSYYASPVAADGRIYVASSSGVVTVLKAGPTVEVLAKNTLQERIFATPAIADDRLYVRTVRKLYCFGAR